MPYFIGYCKQCDSTRYRSIRDLAPGAAKPEDFIPVDPAQPMPKSGEPALCSVCQQNLIFMPERGAQDAPVSDRGLLRQAAVQAREELVSTGQEVSSVAKTPLTIQTLFEVRQDEKILKFSELTKESILIITDKRIVFINLLDVLLAGGSYESA